MGKIRANGKPIELERSLACSITDLNNDGLLDIVAGPASFRALYPRVYFNKGTATEFNYTTWDTLSIGGKKKKRMGFSATFTDLDGDGLKDIYFTDAYYGASNIETGYFYALNKGTAESYRFAAPVKLENNNLKWRSNCATGDLNGDGKEDLLLSLGYRDGAGTAKRMTKIYVRYNETATEIINKPKLKKNSISLLSEIRLSVVGNLLRAVGAKQNSVLSIIDIKGREVQRISLVKGSNSISIKSLNRGLYILKYQIETYCSIQKIILR